jgi:hypothetical protein
LFRRSCRPSRWPVGLEAQATHYDRPAEVASGGGVCGCPWLLERWQRAQDVGADARPPTEPTELSDLNHAAMALGVRLPTRGPLAGFVRGSLNSRLTGLKGVDTFRSRVMANSPSILLLPGLDGTGRLFSPFLRALPANLSAQAVRYPLVRPRRAPSCSKAGASASACAVRGG